jgi:hypothetical protein
MLSDTEFPFLCDDNSRLRHGLIALCAAAAAQRSQFGSYGKCCYTVLLREESSSLLSALLTLISNHITSCSRSSNAALTLKGSIVTMPVDIRNSAHLREVLAEQGKLVVVDFTATWW